jgi:hypothetical protein
MTPTEWAKQSDYEKQMWDEVQGRKGSTNEGMIDGSGRKCVSGLMNC